ncbi:von Willebrand factor d and egf domain-containing protein-like [Plakobranchus ocellatus]|uniref:von Willebrand factor d and egf domain-containing protein-like n=1 Tax=Plakobranchus ocellatus TaxID=259542 RepID=A0AAV3ZUL6_9GAST|nr:von Willebrand factor d and egf domain-containing protein-like [Plakobranchus ocellatus]
MTGHPVLSGPHIDGSNTSFSMSCLVKAHDQDPNQRFEVKWTFDGQEDTQIARKVFSDPVRVVTLDGKRLKNHLNQKVACSARSFYVGHEGRASNFRKSNDYFAGVQVSPNPLSISEADPVKKLKVASSVPIVCSDRADCCLMLKMGIDAAHELTVQQSCAYRLCSHHWDDNKKKAEISIPFLATRDLIREGQTRSLLTFEELLPAGGGEYLNLFEGFIPGPVPIDVDDSRTFTCTLYGDPHVVQVDSRISPRSSSMDFFKTGTFTAYRATNRDFEVQVRTWICSGRAVSCVCGVTVRESNDLIKIDQCDQNRRGSVSPVVSVANPLSNGAKIERSRDGKHIQVLLPSGSLVKIKAEQSHMTVRITTPGSDKASAVGLCGTTDGVATNENTRPDGVVDLPCSPHVQTCRPRGFINSWRVSPGTNLFNSAPPIVAVPPEDEATFCSCSTRRSVTKPMGNCSPRQHISKDVDRVS